MSSKESKPLSAPGAQPARWTSTAPRDATPTDRLAALFRAGETAEGLTGAERARIWSRLTATAPSFQWRSLAGLRWVIAVAVLLTSGGVIGAVTAHRWWPTPDPIEVPSDERPPTVRSRSRRARVTPAPVVTAPPAPAVEPPVEIPTTTAAPTVDVQPAPIAVPAAVAAVSAPPARPRPSDGTGQTLRRTTDVALLTRMPTPAAAMPPPQPVPSTLSGEAQLLGEAMARLRRQGDAAGALSTLELYRQRFPHGTLQGEAELARADALLSLGDDAGALAVLRPLSLQPRGHDQELRVIRGELSAANSCPRAVVDFDAVLGQAAPPALIERALYGRAVCRTKLGDGAGATSDLRAYLRRFPRGQFAADARRSIGNN